MIRGSWRECELLHTIGRRVRDARTGAAMSQRELADRVCMSRPSIANLEAGNQEVPVTRLALIAQVLDLSLVDLVKDPDPDPVPAAAVGEKESDMTETFTDYQAALDIIGDRAREAREAAGLTQEQLGKLIGASQPEVSRWEAGERILSLADFLAIADALQVPASALLPNEHQDLFVPSPGGQWMEVSFMGFAEVTGYVTDITLGGEPGYHIDLPDKVFGGNPMAWEEWSLKALRMRRPMAEASVRKAWEAERKRAAERARQEAEWRRAQEQRAITSGSGDVGDDTDDGDGFGEAPF